MRNRILLYLHYNRFGELADYVPYQLEKIRPIFDRVFFITNSELSPENIARLKNNQLIDDFLIHENDGGYDFKAWSDTMNMIGFDKLAEYDSVTIMNDTCFGPVYDFAPTFEEFDKNAEVDFWGLTNNRAQDIRAHWDPSTPIHLPNHIQSYFVSYKQNMVKSEAFKNFWKEIKIFDHVLHIIVEYETKMTKYFEDAGFKSDCVFNTLETPWSPLEMPTHDFSVFALPELMRRKFPFLKIRAFTNLAKNIFTPAVIDVLERNTDYPVQYIVDHMTFADYPDREYMLPRKTIAIKGLPETEPILKAKVGIHLHVFYEDLLEEFVAKFDKYVGDYDLYLTTDTEEKKAKILELSSGNTHLKEVLVTGNVGRDVLPWQLIHDRLDQYDYAGHFHTKKSAFSAWIIGETWREHIMDSLIAPAKHLFEVMDKTPKVGLIIPDVPVFFNSHHGPTYYSEKELWKYMVDLWEAMGFGGSGDYRSFQEQESYVMSYGTMLWYRPAALKSLLALDIKDQIPAEPLPFTSILHAFERIIVYTAWANGFDFRIAENNPQTGFIVNRSSNRMLMEASSDLNFYSTKGAFVIFLKTLRRLVKKKLGLKIED
ncbi:MAG: rhamnan synthesis F family protein [Streptococcaceae bacterium]|jgi:rhamnosyltransferase|nr:rhamnan synthesis F family protein [Streptococcaceae bacterium]